MFDSAILTSEGDPKRCIITAYVDDLLISGYDDYLVLELLKENFMVREFGEIKSLFELSQSGCIENILRLFNLSNMNPMSTALEIDPNVISDDFDLGLRTVCR